MFGSQEYQRRRGGMPGTTLLPLQCQAVLEDVCVCVCVCMRACMCVCTHVRAPSVMSNSVIPWTVAHQAPLSMEFPRQEHWSGLTFPSPGALPDPGIEPEYLVSPALAGGFFTS